MQDALTGLANRRHFNNVFEHEWKRALREKNVLSIIMVDIDLFKSYNDIYGHQAGDECLSKLGKCLMTLVHRP